MHEKKLVMAIGRRDETAIAYVINKYSRLLWPIASAVLKNTGTEQDVEECVADAFVYLWEHPQRFDPNRGALKTLLCVIVRSKAIDRYRELMRQQTLPLEAAMVSAGPELMDELTKKEIRKELLMAIAALEESNREIFIRRYYHEQKPREIALALGMTVKQVDNSLYRSKQHLRKTLTAKGGAK